MNSLSLRVKFETPAWLNEHAITIKETADVLDSNADTIHSWIRISKAMGHLIPIKRRHRRLLTPHNVYTVGIIVALAKAGVPINESIIRRAVQVTRDADGTPDLPGLMDIAEFAEFGTDGKPFARIEVDIGTVWASIEPKLSTLMASAQQ